MENTNNERYFLKNPKESLSKENLLDTESKTSKLYNVLKEKFHKAYHKETLNVSFIDIAKIASEYSSIDLAHAIIHLPAHVRPVLYDSLPSIDAKIDFIINTDSETRIKIFRYMKDSKMKQLFEKMPTDEAVWVMEDLSQRRFKRMIELIDTKKALKIKEQKKHHRNSAGRLMSTEFFAFSMNMTIKESANIIRDNPSIDLSKGIFV